MKIKYIFILISIIILIPMSSAENPIEKFRLESDFPTPQLINSSLHTEAQYSIISNYNTKIQINFIIEQENLKEKDEWNTTFILNNIEYKGVEDNPGVFTSNEIQIYKGFHTLKVILQSKPNIIPATYDYIITINSENIKLKSTPSSFGGFYVAAPTSTPVPTPATTITSTPLQNTITTNQSVTVPQESFPTTKINSIFLGLLICIILLALLYRRHKKRKPIQPLIIPKEEEEK